MKKRIATFVLIEFLFFGAIGWVVYPYLVQKPIPLGQVLADDLAYIYKVDFDKVKWQDLQ